MLHGAWLVRVGHDPVLRSLGHWQSVSPWLGKESANTVATDMKS